MPEYRLYRLRANNSIIDILDVALPDDDAAIAEAFRIDHATYIEIWLENRMIARIASQNESAKKDRSKLDDNGIRA